jgi:hypothetical protein
VGAVPQDVLPAPPPGVHQGPGVLPGLGAGIEPVDVEPLALRKEDAPPGPVVEPQLALGLPVGGLGAPRGRVLEVPVPRLGVGPRGRRRPQEAGHQCGWKDPCRQTPCACCDCLEDGM